MAREIALSFCTFNNGAFDVMVRDVETGREYTFSGHQKVSDDDLDFLNELAPSCVWTRYRRTSPED